MQAHVGAQALDGPVTDALVLGEPDMNDLLLGETELDATWGPEDNSDDTTVRLKATRKRKAPVRTKASEKRARKVKGMAVVQRTEGLEGEGVDPEMETKQARWVACPNPERRKGSTAG